MSIKEQIVWSGMLLKSPPKCKKVDDSTSFTKWESRFFEFVFLRDENTHVLRYFIDESKSKFKKEIALGADSEAKLFTNIESKHRKNVFCIASPKRRFFMSAQSAHTAKKWFTELATACPHLTHKKSAEMDTTTEREELKQLEEQLESQEIEEYQPDDDDDESNPVKIEQYAQYDTLEQLIDPNTNRETEMYVDMRSTTPSMSKRMSNISSSVSSSDTMNELTYGNWEMHRQNESDKAVVAEDSSKGAEEETKEQEVEETPSIPSRSLKNKPEPEPTELHYIDLSNSEISENVEPTRSETIISTEYADIDPTRTQALESAKKITTDSPSTGRQTRHSHTIDDGSPPLLPLKLNETPKPVNNDTENAEDYVDQLLSILPDAGDPTYTNTVCLDVAMTSKRQSTTPSTSTQFIAPTQAQTTTRQQPYVNICLPQT